jgi:hypothetical protein
MIVRALPPSVVGARLSRAQRTTQSHATGEAVKISKYMFGEFVELTRTRRWVVEGRMKG